MVASVTISVGPSWMELEVGINGAAESSKTSVNQSIFGPSESFAASIAKALE